MPVVTTPACMVCKQTTRLTLTDAELAAYKRGAFIQDIFPSWTPAQRELLISGTHPSCWNEIFGEGDE